MTYGVSNVHVIYDVTWPRHPERSNAWVQCS